METLVSKALSDVLHFIAESQEPADVRRKSLHVGLHRLGDSQPLTGQFTQTNFSLIPFLVILTAFVLNSSSVAFFGGQLCPLPGDHKGSYLLLDLVELRCRSLVSFGS